MFNKDELERYSRQILLIGQKGQRSLKESRVLVIGAGGIGSALLPYLASAGVGYIRISEPDVVEMSNLGRQILYKPQDCGALKGPVAVRVLEELNPNIELEWSSTVSSGATIGSIASGVDLIIDGSDSIESKFVVSDFAYRNQIPFIIGSIGARQGHIFISDPSHKTACYRCLFEKPPEPGTVPTCSTEGVLSPLPGVIGSMMAYLTVQYFLAGQFEEKIYLFEPGGWRTRKFSINRECLHGNPV